jgi:hypothetical protein
MHTNPAMHANPAKRGMSCHAWPTAKMPGNAVSRLQPANLFSPNFEKTSNCFFPIPMIDG